MEFIYHINIYTLYVLGGPPAKKIFDRDLD